MNDTQLLTLQKIIIEHFKDVDNITFCAFIDSFVYYKPALNGEVSKMIENFLKANRLEMAYLNYVSDFVIDEKRSYLRRSTGSEISMIENVKMALLNASFNRLRQIEIENNIDKRIKREHAEMKESVSKLMDAGSNDRYHDALDELKEIYLNWQSDK